MSHFSVIVSCRNMDPERALAPYDENMKVAPYIRDCYCVQSARRDKRRAILDAEFGPGYMDQQRAIFWAGPQERQTDAVWQAMNATYFARMDAVDKLFADEFEPKPTCGTCNGTGRYETTYNPLSKWDYYGLIETIKVRKNSAIRRPFAFIDHDGEWHERGRMGWWAIVTEDREAEYQAEWEAFLASCHSGDTLALYDCHI